LAPKLESISAFFPAYNDAATIGGLVEKTFELLKASGREFEILVVNDGSRDATPRVLERLQKQYGAAFRVVHHPVNRGYGAALRSGFGAATKELVFYTDGDGQYDPAELAALLPHMKPSVGLVNGYKTRRSDPFHRIFIGTTYNTIVSVAFGLRVRDIDCAMKVFRREVFDGLRLDADGPFLSAELLIKLRARGVKMAQVGVNHYPRAAGQNTGASFRKIVRTFGDLAKLRWALWTNRDAVLRRAAPRDRAP